MGLSDLPLDRRTVSGGDGYLNLRGTYPAGKGAYGHEGVTRVVVTGANASVTAGGSTLVVAKATKVLLLTKLGRYDTSTGWNSQPWQTELAALSADFAALLSRQGAPGKGWVAVAVGITGRRRPSGRSTAAVGCARSRTARPWSRRAAPVACPATARLARPVGRSVSG